MSSEFAFDRQFSTRSHVRAWTCYTALGYVSVTATIIALTLPDLEMLVHQQDAEVHDPRQLNVVFLGRTAGAILGTLCGGWLCDKLPLKPLMSGCIAASGCSLAVLPLAATMGLAVLSLAFGVLGFFGSSLVCCALMTASWAFPGASGGPVFAGMAAASSITGAVLPIALRGVRNVTTNYLIAAASAVPSLALLLISTVPEKQVSHSENSDSGMFATCLAAAAQFMVQGAYSALLNWIVTYCELLFDERDAGWFLTVMLGFVTLGTMGCRELMRYVKILDLAWSQLSLTCLALVPWLALPMQCRLLYGIVAFYGLVACPVLSYPNALLNQAIKPSGSQLAFVSLGANTATSLAPSLAGASMEKFGPSALPWILLIANVVVLSGFLLLKADGCCSKGDDVASTGRDAGEGVQLIDK